MPQIFISYSRRDIDFVRKLVERLEALDRSVWVDWESIPWTADWWHEICQGIESSDNFVFVLSPNSLSSVVCTLEVAHAIENNKRLVPIVLEEGDPSEAAVVLAQTQLDSSGQRLLAGRDLQQLAATNWQRIARHNWMFFKEAATFDQSIANLIEAVDTDLDYLRDHTRLLMRAHQWADHKRDGSFLLEGTELASAEMWLSQSGGKEPTPAGSHTEYIFASRQRANRRQRNALIGVSGALLVTIVLTVLSALLWREASLERDRANRQAQISESGRVALQGLLELEDRQLDRALLLGLEALQIFDTAEARSSLLTSLQSAPQLQQFSHVHTDWVRAAAYHPDGTQYATADSSGQIVLWDAATNAPRDQWTVEQPIWDMAYNPDGSLLATTDNSGAIRLWDTTTGESAGEFADEANTLMFSLAFHPDGAWLATGSRGGHIYLWNIVQGRQMAMIEGHSDEVWALAFHPDGTQLASGDRVGEIILWEVEDDALRERTRLTAHTNWILSLAFRPDGAVLASGAGDGALRLWDVAAAQPMGAPITDHLDWVRVVTFSTDGTLLVSASDDQRLILRNPQTGSRLSDVAPLVGHGAPIGDTALSPDGVQVVSGDRLGDVVVWDTRVRQPFSADVTRVEGEAFAVAVSPDGAHLAVGSTAGSATLLDAATGDPLHAPFATEREVTRITFNADGTRLAYATADGRVTLRDVASGAEVFAIEAHDGPAWDLAFHPDDLGGERLITAGADGTVRVWNADGTLADAWLSDANVELVALALNPADALLAVGSMDGRIFLWDMAANALRETLEGHADRITQLAFNAAGTRLASGSRDDTAIVWDMTLEMPQGSALAEHDSWVLAVAFSPDGNTLVTGSRDETLILWDTLTLQPIGTPFENQGGWVLAVAFAPDGNTLVTGSRDGALSRWTLSAQAWRERACAIANRPLSEAEVAQYLPAPPPTLTCAAR